MSLNRCVYAFYALAPAEADRSAATLGRDSSRPDAALIVIMIVAGFGWIAAASMVEQALHDVIWSCC